MVISDEGASLAEDDRGFVTAYALVDGMLWWRHLEVRGQSAER